MNEILVHLGNVAVTESRVVPSTQEAAEAAGPLGRMLHTETGDVEYGVLTQIDHPVIRESVTTFRDHGEVANGYPLSDFLRDVRTAFGGQHSSAPPAWVVCSDPAVGRLIAMELRGDGPEVPVLAEVPGDAGAGCAGTVPSDSQAVV